MSETSGLYLRRASGLVRIAGPWSSLAFNVIWTGNCVGLIAAFILNSFPFISPGQNIPLLIIVASLLSTLNTATYMFFSMVIPRSGGDYHYIGRTLHPSLGFVSSVNWAIWLPLVLGWAASVIIPIALSSVLISWGTATNNPGALQMADWLNTPDKKFLVGAVVIIVFTAITLLGNKVYFAIQNIAFALMLVGIVITFAAFLSNNPTTFASSIDKLLGPDTYQSTIRSFETQFPTIERPALIAIPSGITLWAGINTWACGSSLIAGEVKDERKLRTWLIANVLGSFFVGGVMALTAYLYFTSVGEKFIYAMTYLSGSPDSRIVFPPFYASFIPIAFPNVIIFVLFAGAFFLGGTFFMPQNQILGSRVMLAWSLDRLMPRQLGYVDRKFHQPVVATTDLRHNIIDFALGIRLHHVARVLLAAFRCCIQFLTNSHSRRSFPIPKEGNIRSFPGELPCGRNPCHESSWTGEYNIHARLHISELDRQRSGIKQPTIGWPDNWCVNSLLHSILHHTSDQETPRH